LLELCYKYGLALTHWQFFCAAEFDADSWDCLQAESLSCMRLIACDDLCTLIGKIWAGMYSIPPLELKVLNSYWLYFH